MREVSIDDKRVRVRATPLALLYYKQEFKSDFVATLLKMMELKHDPSLLDTVAVMQVVWAMAKADCGPGNPFPSFEEWVAGLESFDFADKELINAVTEEAASGFFRGGTKTKPKKQRKK